VPPIRDIRRAIRRLGARGLKLAPGRRNSLLEAAVRLLRQPDDVLMAIYQASIEDPQASSGEVHAALMVNGVVCTFDHVRVLRKACGFTGRGPNPGETVARDEKGQFRQSRDASEASIMSDMPGRLRAQLDQLPETEQRKALAGWAR
jgi:hypothetical protein